ncbi:unnamed protein product [Malus baccata var. baccata]
MAESVVCFVIDKLISLLNTKEAKLSRDVRAEVGFLRDELESIRSFLKDADAKAAAAAEGDMVTDSAKTWVKQEAEVVGVESARDELIIGWYGTRGEYREVISVVGMGGLGKTTLAKKVFDNQKVIEHFNCHAWITVSQTYKVDDLLRQMVMQFYKARKEYTPEGIDTMEKESLIRKSRELLQQKRCSVLLLVGSPLVIAAPDVFVGYCRRVEWEGEKFKTMVFVSRWSSLCVQLWYAECGNVGGAADERNQGEHSALPFEYELLIPTICNNPIFYHHLPNHLKSCVLYFGIFPEDYSISCIRLVRLWIAEDFVKLKRGKTLEEVAEEYLTELIHRSLVQVSKMLPRIIFLYVGDLYLLKYLSLRNTKVKLLPESICNLQNLETLDLKQSLVYEIPAKINKLLRLRHLLAHYIDSSSRFGMISYERGVKIHDGVGCLQALQQLYHVETNHGGINLIKALEKLRQLRKLGLKNLKREYGRALCASIEKMNHLESLEVSTISEDEVLDLQSISTPPESIQFLYLKGPLEKLPSWIPKLQQLVRLRIFWSRLTDAPPKALQNLPNLVELGYSYNAYDGVQLHFEGGFKELRVDVASSLEVLFLHPGVVSLTGGDAQVMAVSARVLLRLSPHASLYPSPMPYLFLRQMRYLPWKHKMLKMSTREQWQIDPRGL